MNTLKAPIASHVPTEVTKANNDDIRDSEQVSGTWFCTIVMLVLGIAGFYLLWAKVSAAWPFSH